MTVPREVTQAKLNRLSAATLAHKPSQTYTIADRLEEKARAHPDRAFVLFEGRTRTYGQINAAANRIAHLAVKEGLRRGDVVALLMENRPEFLICWMGLAKLGITTGLLNTNTMGRALEHEVRTTAARVLLVGRECVERLRTLDREALELDRILVLDDPTRSDPYAEAEAGFVRVDRTLESMPTTNPDPRLRSGLVAGDDLFYIFTSGTTGLPKAARLSHMRYLGVGDGMSAVAEYGPADVIACVLPLYHGAGGMVVVSCALAQGAAILLCRRFSASGFWDDVRRHDVTGFQYIGEICRYLLHQPPRAKDCEHGLRVMMGAGLGADIWQPFQERFGVERILEGWSSTEANTSLINLDGRPGSCGRIPFKDRHNGRLVRFDVESETYPRDEEGFLIECLPGEVGEFIGAIPELPDSGAGRFEGYTSEEATERKILRNVFAPGDRWYRSGDLLRQDSDGYFYFVDRIGDTFRWKSENVSTQEVAEALQSYPGLQIANVYGVAVPGTEGRAGMAALVLEDPASFDGRVFYEFTRRRLPPYAAPVFLRLSRAADVTSTFKLRKFQLQRESYDPNRVSDPLFVRDESKGAYVPLLDPNRLPRL